VDLDSRAPLTAGVGSKVIAVIDPVVTRKEIAQFILVAHEAKARPDSIAAALQQHCSSIDPCDLSLFIMFDTLSYLTLGLL
jgi:hypothetical protein